MQQENDPEDFREWARQGIEAGRLGFEANPHAVEFALQADRFARSIGEPTPTWAIAAVEKNRKWGRDVIERSCERFSKTGNPMYACRAYLEARSIGDPLPDWVQDYIDNSMSLFWRMFQGFNGSKVKRSRDNRPAEAFAEAFRMKAPKVGRAHGKTGSGTVWTRFGDTDWISQALTVRSVIEERIRAGKPNIKLMDEATERYNTRNPIPLEKVSYAKMRRAWLRFEREWAAGAFPDIPQEVIRFLNP
jgi:hypothetical protein